MPRWIPITLLMLASLALIPVACVARSRTVRSPLPRVHLVPDMDNQGRFKPQQANPMFADRRAMRPPVEGTVARGFLALDDHYWRGVDAGDYATSLPVEMSSGLLERGRERYAIYCAPCHGLAGYGDGMVSQRAIELQQGAWVPPSSLHDEPAYSRPPGHLFNSITNGIRNMPAYGTQIDVEDRWAIVAYVEALKRSQHARLEDVPPSLRSSVREIQP